MILDAALPEESNVAGFIYTPSLKNDKAGTIFRYRAEASSDGITWNAIPTKGEFSNIVNNPIPQQVVFDTPVKARYLRLVALSEIEGRNTISYGDFRILLKPVN